GEPAREPSHLAQRLVRPLLVAARTERVHIPVDAVVAQRHPRAGPRRHRCDPLVASHHSGGGHRAGIPRFGREVTAGMTTLGIIGAGPIGSQVARVAVTAGYDVVIANSRGPEEIGRAT